jgi:hypothetical protein
MNRVAGMAVAVEQAVSPARTSYSVRRQAKPPAPGLWPFMTYSGAGNRACRRPFRPPSNLNRPPTLLAGIFSGFVSRRDGAAKPEKFVSKPGGRLKAVGTLWAQPRLDAPRKAKATNPQTPGHLTIFPAVIFLALAMMARPVCACQCERFSTCNEVAATNLVFIGTVESIDPMFLNRWNDTSQSSLRSLNDSFLQAQAHPSADALTKLKDAYLKTFPDASPDRKSQIQKATTASSIAALFYSNVGRGMKIRFRVQTLFKHQDDDADDDKKALESTKKNAEDILEVSTPFGDCGVSFQTGETYLVYATDDEESSDSIATDSCTRTRRLSDAGEDLAYLYFYKEHPEESTRIDGFATTNSRYRVDFNPLHPERIQPLIRNVVIELESGNLARFTETDQNGHFVFDGLHGGDYTLIAFDSDYPKGKQLSADAKPFHLQPKSCSLQIVVLTKDAIQGETPK